MENHCFYSRCEYLLYTNTQPPIPPRIFSHGSLDTFPQILPENLTISGCPHAEPGPFAAKVSNSFQQNRRCRRLLLHGKLLCPRNMRLAHVRYYPAGTTHANHDGRLCNTHADHHSAASRLDVLFPSLSLPGCAAPQ